MYITNMKYNKSGSIIGYDGKLTRMPRDRVKRIRMNRSGVAVDTRKGKRTILFFTRPWALVRGLVG